MKSRFFLLAALLAASPVSFAQEDKPIAGADAPSFKHKEHDALKLLAGTWDSICKMEAMPGVPGMEKPTECSGTEHAELICDGLWLKSVMSGIWNGEHCEGLFLVGYDPYQKHYTGMWVGSQEPGASEWKGHFDEKSKTWTWTGTTPMGEMRSTVVFRGPDQTVETCYLKGADGNEKQCVQITRTRSKGVAAAPAAAKAAAPLAKEVQLLHQDIGRWNTKMEIAAAPGAAPTTDKGTEEVTAICNGTWLWSNFHGQMNGAPFTGHGITGYDPTIGKYVSFWLDSWSPVYMKSLGDYDAAKSCFTYAGTGVDETGKPLTSKLVCTLKGPDSRIMDMEFKTAERTTKMQITYERAKK